MMNVTNREDDGFSGNHWVDTAAYTIPEFVLKKKRSWSIVLKYEMQRLYLLIKLSN
jgi:hypothetical protein